MTTQPTLASVTADITPSIAAMPMNGEDGLRKFASLLGIKGIKAMGKADLVSAVAEAKASLLLPGVVADWQAAQPAVTQAFTTPNVQDAHQTRNHNVTIRPQGAAAQALIDGVWAALTRDGGITTAALTAMVCDGTPGLKAGSVVSRLATQRNNGNVTSSNATDEHNRTITSWHAAPSWSKDAMARAFLKVR